MNSASKLREYCVHILEPDRDTRHILKEHCNAVGLRTFLSDCMNEFFERLAVFPAGCIVLALCAPGLHGFEVRDALKRQRITTPLIFVSGFADASTVAQALREGAFDFFEKPFSPQLLIRRVREAISLHIRRNEQVTRRQNALDRLARLSVKDREVVDLMVRGLGNKQIASELHLSEKAIEARRRRARMKLGIEQPLEMARVILESQMVPMSTWVGQVPATEPGEIAETSSSFTI